MIIQLTEKIDNASLQVGDHAYYIDAYLLENFEGQLASSSPVHLGEITDITSNTIKVEAFLSVPIGSYIMFAKDNRVNGGSLKGYYASVKMRNADIKKAELFAISSEVTESSK
jgi:hypothetical protein|tara:strand:- start:182 stop:520 length:339 start_codon:yes stop_codon:yes gene_type:complete